MIWSWQDARWIRLAGDWGKARLTGGSRLAPAVRRHKGGAPVVEPTASVRSESESGGVEARIAPAVSRHKGGAPVVEPKA